METKDFPVEIKSADGEAGTFEALVSVFGNVDLVGDRVQPGAFTKTLENFRAKGQPIPVVLSHQWDDPMYHVGAADPANVKQTPRGLVVQGKLDIADNPVAKQVHRLMREKRLTGFSFGYTVPEGGQAIAEDGVNDVTEIDLVEVGPTLKGANPEAQLQAVKSALEEEKAVWTTAYINELPDSAFLYIEDGGEKDGDGKTTPRSLRHFPYKDSSGAVDLPHLRNALARIPQSNLPEGVKDSLTAKAQQILDSQNGKSVAVEDAKDEEPTEAKSLAQDPLRKQSLELVLEVRSDGLNRRPKSPPPPEEPERDPAPDRDTVKELSRRSILDVLSA